MSAPAGPARMVSNAEILVRAGVTRERLGESVRKAWVRWAQAQPAPKGSWLIPFSELSPADQEADMAIGEALFCSGWRMRDWLPGEGTVP